MNIELRWVERDVHNATAEYVGRERVLQYRTREPNIVGMDPFGHSIKHGPWSDWRDVPVEAE